MNSHAVLPKFHGGHHVGNNNLYLNTNFSFLLGENNNTFLSFYPGDKITIHLTDDIIYDSVGTDIFFNIYNLNFTTNYANVYVGTTEDELSFMDVLNFTQYEFDIIDYNVTTPIRYIELEFLGNENIHFNLKNILFQRFDRYSKPYTYTLDFKEGQNNIVFFINNCGETIPCGLYCDFNMYDNAHYYSC